MSIFEVSLSIFCGAILGAGAFAMLREMADRAEARQERLREMSLAIYELRQDVKRLKDQVETQRGTA